MRGESQQHMNSEKVLILSTGGTLGMRPGLEGELRPDQVLDDLLHWVPELERIADVEVEILANLDSSLIGPDIWLKLATRIQKAQGGKWRGVVVLHGTDTLAFSASALSFLLLDLNMPVVFTGAQKPLADPRSDARNNILGAVETVLFGPIEVMLFFNNKCFRGNRVTKAAIGDFDAFQSPNYPLLGRAGIHWEWNRENFWPRTMRPTLSPAIPERLPTPPWVLPWVPGLSFWDFESALDRHWALILEGFGTGNLALDEITEAALKAFMKRGGLVLLKSQVAQGKVSLSAYAPGKRIRDLGIIGVHDMTREALVTKLMVLKGWDMTRERMAHQTGVSLAGELSTEAPRSS